jgi:hypothetical protein
LEAEATEAAEHTDPLEDKSSPQNRRSPLEAYLPLTLEPYLPLTWKIGALLKIADKLSKGALLIKELS